MIWFILAPLLWLFVGLLLSFVGCLLEGDDYTVEYLCIASMGPLLIIAIIPDIANKYKDKVLIKTKRNGD